MGKINNIEKFDASFFGVHNKQVACMDPMSRLLIEHSFEAIIDAGVNPRKLRRTNTGVFIACYHSETESDWLSDENKVKNDFNFANKFITILILTN